MSLLKKKIILLTLGIFLIIINTQSCKEEKVNKEEKEIISILPGIESFIKNHPEYGTLIINAVDQPDWAEGKRQQIDTDKGSFLFYLKNDTVSGVWKYNSDGTRTKLY